MTVAFTEIVSTVLPPVYFLSHGYLYLRISRGLRLSTKGKWMLGSILFILMALSTPAVVEVTHWISARAGTAYQYVAFGWIGVSLVGVMTLLAVDASRVLVKLSSRVSTNLATRADAFSHKLTSVAVTIGALTILGAISAYGLFEALRPPAVNRIMIDVPGIQRDLTIVQLSDMHLGPVFGTERLAAILAKVRGIAPDLLVLTGDILDADITMADARTYIDTLSTLKTRCGTLAVLGNQEGYVGIDEVSEMFRAAGIRLMRDTLVTLEDGVQIAGVDDYGAARDLSNRRRLNALLEERAVQRPLVLLAHDPTFFEDEADRGVLMQLSGHTHGGQVAPISLLARLKFKHISGLYRHNGSFIYVSNGLGTRGPLMRLLSRSEIVVIQLRGNRVRP